MKRALLGVFPSAATQKLALRPKMGQDSAGDKPAEAAGGNGLFSFPCFRDDDFVARMMDESLVLPKPFLIGEDLTPLGIKQNYTAHQFPAKVEKVKDQFRHSLFRQAIFKIQNVEVVHMGECKEQRIVKEIIHNQNPSTWMDLTNPSDVSLMREEIWKVGLALVRGFWNERNLCPHRALWGPHKVASRSYAVTLKHRL